MECQKHYLETNALLFFISFIAGYILSGVSLFTSTAISLDRLLSLLLGLKYKLVVTLKRALFIVTIIWIVGVVCSALYLWNDQIPLTYAYVCTWICLVISVYFLHNNFSHPPISANTSSRPY